MRIDVIFLFLLLTLSACNKDQEKLPIREEKMIDILVDVHVAEAAMQELSSVIRDSLGEVYYGQIFEIHDITEEDFNKTMYLIKQDPEHMERIYKEVLVELDKKMEISR